MKTEIKNKKRLFGIISVLFVAICMVLAFTSFGYPKETTKTKDDATTASEKKAEEEKKAKEALLNSLPDVFSNDEELVLVNASNEFTKTSDELNLILMNNGIYYFDADANQKFNEWATAASEANYTLVTVSAYRSKEMQQTAYDNSLQDYISQGMTEEEAKKKTSDYMMNPGFSEHQTGLAIDIVDLPWDNTGKGLIAEFGTTDVAKWLADNAATYGFILRYPQGKEDITGISYEPWHFRYVGVENAKYIKANNLTLEEYLGLLKEAGK